jgi:hypothetical protein
MNSILFSNQKPTNGKKGKSHKMYVFAQDIGIRNSVCTDAARVRMDGKKLINFFLKIKNSAFARPQGQENK